LLANKLLMLAGALLTPKRLNKLIVFSTPRDGVRKSRLTERLFFVLISHASTSKFPSLSQITA